MNPGSPTRNGAAAPVSPSNDDPGLRALSEGIGGPLGEHAGRHPWWTPVRVLLALTAVCFALGVVKDAPCYRQQWSDSNTNYTNMCYSDLPYLYTGRGFAELNWPYADDEAVRARYPAMEYPVVISYWAWWTAERHAAPRRHARPRCPGRDAGRQPRR